MKNDDKTVEESIDNKDVVVGGGGIGDDDIIEWYKICWYGIAGKFRVYNPEMMMLQAKLHFMKS